MANRTKSRRFTSTVALTVAMGAALLSAIALAGATNTPTLALSIVLSTNGTCDTGQPVCRKLANGDVISVQGSGFTPAQTASALECNSDPAQPVVSFLNNDIPVSCTPVKLTSTSATGTLTTNFSVKTGTTGPPVTGLVPRCYNTGGTTTTTTTTIVGCTTSGNATTDAAKYPCPPTAAQITAGDECVLAIGDVVGERAIGVVLFGSESLQPCPVTTTTAFIPCTPNTSTTTSTTTTEVSTSSSTTTTQGPTTTSTTTTTIDPTESFTSSQVSAATLALDGSGTVSDTVTVRGSATYGSPAGTVTFYWCQVSTASTLAPAPCAATVSNEVGQAHPLAGSNDTSSAVSPALTPTAAGTWCFSATYTPQGSYQASEDDTTAQNVDPNECSLVSSYPSTTGTFISSSAVTLGPGGTVSDTAIVSGNTTGGPPSGAVSFYACQTGTTRTFAPGPCPASGTPEDPSVPLVGGAGVASSASSADFTPSAAGTWCFSATYAGDSNYEASSDNTGAANADSGECVLVAPADTAATSSVSAPSVAFGPSGTVTDTVTVSGNTAGGPPTGSVVFYVCQTGTTQTLAPAACAATGTPEDPGALLVGGPNGTAQATSAAFTPDALGTWCFSATYAGDPNYNGSTDNTGAADLDSGECVLVGPSDSTFVTAPSSPTFVVGQSGPITDTAFVEGNALAGMPDGVVDFYVCGPLPGTALCTSVSSPLGTPSLTSVGSDVAIAASDGFSPPSPGTWCFGAVFVPSAGSEYAGAGDNVSGTPDSGECVAAYAPYTFTSANSLTVKNGASFTFTVNTAGAPVASIRKHGKFPRAVGYHNNKDGTGTLHGFAKKTGTFVVTFRAKFGSGTTKHIVYQTFTLTVN